MRETLLGMSERERNIEKAKTLAKEMCEVYPNVYKFLSDEIVRIKETDQSMAEIVNARNEFIRGSVHEVAQYLGNMIAELLQSDNKSDEAVSADRQTAKEYTQLLDELCKERSVRAS